MSEYEELIREARRVHTVAGQARGDPYCDDCGENWPCFAIRLADALEATIRERSEALTDNSRWNRTRIVVGMRRAIDNLTAENAALLEIATTAVSATANDDWRNRWMARLNADHLGASLLARLEAAEAVVEAALAVSRCSDAGNKSPCHGCIRRLNDALDAYEAVRR